MNVVFSNVSRSARLIVVALSLLATQQAFAVGTPAGDTVSNVASVDYSVGGVAQDRVDSAAVDFVVDRLVNFTLVVTDAVSTSVTPGGTSTITSLTLTNIGNADTDFRLEAANIVGGNVNGVDDLFDMDLPIEVFADINGDGLVDAGDTPYVEALDSTAGSNSIGLLIRGTAPSTPTPGNLDGATVELTVTASSGISSGDPVGTPIVPDAGPDVPGGPPQIVLAGTGVQTVQDGFVVNSAVIDVTKISSVLEDPFNGTTDPKAIPGAFVQYEITATNTGLEDATGVVFVDDISSLPVSLNLGQYAGADAQVEQNGTTTGCTLDASDGDGDGCGVAAGVVSLGPVGGFTLGTAGPTSTAVVRFRVVVD